MTLDRRLPAVYVDIEDRSLATEEFQTGRSAYVVLLSDRGPHNKIVEVNSRQGLYDLFGRPDFTKYGHGHYLADQHLRTSNRLYVCRPAMMEPFGDATIEDCMTISNASLKMNTNLNDSEEIIGNFEFVEGSNVVLADSTSLAAYSEVVSDWVGKWVFSSEDTASFAKQIIAVDSTNNELILNEEYEGTSSVSNLKIFSKFVKSSILSMRKVEDCDPLSTETLWYFYAIGAGSYYNDFFIKGVRNTQFEKIYTDANGNSLYPYLFMDIAIYRRNEDNTTTLMEGPWTVSLANRTPSGSIIRDIYTGTEIYITTVINKNSKLIRCVDGLAVNKLITTDKSISHPYEPDVQIRTFVQTLLADNTTFGSNLLGSGGVNLQNGRNGNLFDELGDLNYISNDCYQSLVAQAYNGSLTSTDGSVELILQDIYPWYVFDYVYCGGYGSMVSNAARELVDGRGDCLLLSDTGSYVKTADEDLVLRNSKFDWNTFNAALYVQYRKIEDTHTGKEFYITPVYHALDRHLYTDANYWIAEPVAGIEKGAIGEAIELAYRPNLVKLGDLIEKEMNPVIVEPDGTYLLTQLTTWKRMSVIKRQHVVKFLQFCRKKIPTILKDLLQRKATVYWINQAEERINGFMNPFLDTGELDRYAAITSYSSIVKFDETRSELIVSLTVRPIRAIERITVNILVY